MWEQSLPKHWGVNFRFPDISGRRRGKTKAGIVAEMLFLRGRVALCWALITRCFMESLRGARHTPGLIGHVQAAVKQPLLRITVEYEFRNSGKRRFRPFKCEL